MAIKLDKTRDYGTVHGTHGLARFEQDGKLFDIHGNILGADGMPLKGKTEPAPMAASEEPAVEQGEQQSSAVAEVSKDELIAKAKDLGIKATKNWGIQKLQEEIAAVEAVNEDQVSKSLAG